MVQLHAPLDVRLGASLFQNRVQLRVRITSVVLRTVSMEQDIQEVLWIRVVCLPAASPERLELILVEILEIRGPLDLLDLDLYAELLPPHLNHNFHVQTDSSTRARHGDDDSGPGFRVGVLRLAQKLPGQIRVVLQTFEIGVVTWESRWKYPDGGCNQL